ncbi:MAG: hypothetical protein FWG75_05715 [Cystobacterineae bacterium]|nr:hypothetical protein [Cystobacterineae bacterium]
MRLLLTFFGAEVGASLLIWLGIKIRLAYVSASLPACKAVTYGPQMQATNVGVLLAVVAGLLALGLKAWAMHSKSAKLVQRALLVVSLSLAVRAVILAAGLLWALNKIQAPGAFLLGFLCVYAMQLVLEVSYLALEQKKQSLPKRGNE